MRAPVKLLRSNERHLRWPYRGYMRKIQRSKQPQVSRCTTNNPMCPRHGEMKLVEMPRPSWLLLAPSDSRSRTAYRCDQCAFVAADPHYEPAPAQWGDAASTADRRNFVDTLFKVGNN